MQHFTITAIIVIVGLCGTIAAAPQATIAITATEKHENVTSPGAEVDITPPITHPISTRSGRTLVPHSHIAPYSPRYNLKPLVTRIRPREDNLAGNGPEFLSPHHRRFPQPPPASLPRGGMQIVRRVHKGIGIAAVGQPPRLHYGLGGASFEGAPKNGGRYVGEKAGAGGKPLRGNHPNALSVAADGGLPLPQYVKHPQQQHQQQFKASPHYNGKAIIRPISEFEQQQQQEKHLQNQPQQHLQHQAHLHQQQPKPHLPQQQSVSYLSVKQYSLPQFPPTQQQKHQQQAQVQPHLQQQPHQQQRFQAPYQGQTQKPNFYSGQPKGGESFYTNVPLKQDGQEQKPEPLQQYHHPKESHYHHLHQQFSQQQPQHPSYSVSEEAVDGTNNNGGTSQASRALHGDSHNMVDTNAEAQDYLKFMSTNEYFLPKREPDYKLLDSLNNQRQKQYDHQQQQQYDQDRAQSQQTYSHKQEHQQQQPKTTKTYNNKSVQYSKPAGTRAISSSGDSAASAYQESLRMSQILYDGPSDSSATVVHGSYQAGANTFVVNSDGNKGVKHIVPSPLPVTQETIPSSGASISSFGSSQFYHNGGSSGDGNRRTPEPLRFEFTEHDAVSPVVYTNNPLHQLRYKTASSGESTSTQPPTTERMSSSFYSGHNQHQHHSIHGQNVKPVNESDDDPEDGEDMHEASSNVYGRVPLSPATTGGGISSPHTSSEPQQAQGTEQKDTEEYCERICSSVQDDDEEIVCGSDGYMYTSEQQMDCYAECLRIAVAIQSNGSCIAQ